MALVRCGVPARWLRELAAATDLSRTTPCALLGLKLSTINRKLQQNLPLSPDESERLMALQRLMGQAEAVVRDCGDPEGFDASRWLRAAQPPDPQGAGIRPGCQWCTWPVCPCAVGWWPSTFPSCSGKSARTWPLRTCPAGTPDRLVRL
jgi:hypothetical protein